MRGEIAELVEDAVACLAMEHPPSYAAMQAALGDRRFDLSIDDECFMLELGPVSLRAPTLSVVTDVDTLCALVHGDVGMLDALFAERVDIVASPDDLIAAAAATNWFLQGAMRCVSMPALLDRLVALRKERT